MNTPSDTSTERFASVPTATGGRLATVTMNLCIALVFEPPASVAVTVIGATPLDTGVTVTVEPTAAATVGADDAAPNVSGSLSGSLNAPDTSMFTAPSAAGSVRFDSVPTLVGDRLGTTPVEG